MIASFIVGFIAGMLALLAIAVKYVDHKAKPKQQAVTPSAVGINLSGKSDHRPTLYEQMQVFREPSADA
jgi:Golgi nucleoside diphosphatase